MAEHGAERNHEAGSRHDHITDRTSVVVLANPWTPRSPLRGTQSFVGVMGLVWRRPGLTACELVWRWGIGVPLLALTVWQGERLRPVLLVDTAALAAMTVFKPLAAFATLQVTAASILPALLPTLRWIVPVLLVLWTLAAAAGRALVVRRLDPGARPRWLAFVVLRACRTSALLAVLGVWWVGARWAAAQAITGPGSRGQEPNLVAFCALVICGSIAMFVGWGAANWIFEAAPLLAAQRHTGTKDGVRGALRLGSLRSKLVETNLVMSIVKIALLVLALVFSACPLPFESVASQSFLDNWWMGVGLLYLLACDYFHVVRCAAYLALFGQAAGDPPRQSVSEGRAA